MATAIVLQVLAAQNDLGFSQLKGDVKRFFLRHTAASTAVKALLLVGLASAGAVMA